MKNVSGILLMLVCCWSEVYAASMHSAKDLSFVISGLKTPDDVLLKRSTRSTRSITSSITSMHVTSIVMSRFARVTIVSTMVNDLDESKEMTFSVRLPEAAFITDFEMLVSGITFVGQVKEKEIAKTQFQRAVDKGNTAGLVTADVRETQTFNVAANVPGKSSVTFNLVYQELLKRRLGEYDHVILVNPGQLVDDLMVDIYITESVGISKISPVFPNTGDEFRRKVARGEGDNIDNEIPIDFEIRRSKYQAKISFKPTLTQQRRILMLPEDEQKLTVRYDVTREELGGEIQTRNGYFVHFFAPENLSILPKNVVFIIDRSGSMSGKKMEQTRKAFVSVLKELRETDKFNIVSFSNDVTVWEPGDLIGVTEDSLINATTYVTEIQATGSTNFNDAMLKGAELLKTVKKYETSSSMIIVLTDGQPTAGVTSTAQIRLNVKKEIRGRFSVFCLGFGNDLDHDFLKRLANENDGIARQIYEDSDADLQMEGFFQEVATPLLLEVKMLYRGSKVNNVSTSKFDKYFGGSEFVIVGVMEKKERKLRSVVKGTSLEGKVEYNVHSSPVDESFQHWFKDTGKFDDFIERMWAYFTIKELLTKKDLTDSLVEIENIHNQVIYLALKYNFVTPLTSLVVTLPEDELTTTPPVESTIEPPLPPCFPRGATLPLHYHTSPPIICPYILTDEEIKDRKDTKPSRPQYGRAAQYLPPVQYGQLNAYGQPSAYGQAGQPGQAGQAGQYGSTSVPLPVQPPKPKPSKRRQPSAKRRGQPSSPSKPGQPQYPGPPIQSGQPGYPGPPTPPPTDYPTYKWTTTQRILERPPDCNKLLTSPNGKLESSGNVTSETMCEWTITTKQGSWIDIYIASLDTTRNTVMISADTESIFVHHYGTAGPEYKWVMHNNITVVMNLYPEDNSSIVIFYEQFIPNENKTNVEEMTSDMDIFDQTKSDCGFPMKSSGNMSGSLSSPNYPEAYPSNAHCVWSIVNEDTENLELNIRFEDMDIEMDVDSKCSHDKVVIMEGAKDHVWCGYDVTNAALSTDDEIVKIAFLSDDKLETSGFKIHFEFVKRASSV